MKRIYFIILLSSMLAYGQQAIIKSGGQTLKLVVGVYYNPITNEFSVIDDNGNKIQSLNLANYFALKSDLETLKDELTYDYTFYSPRFVLFGYPLSVTDGYLFAPYPIEDIPGIYSHFPNINHIDELLAVSSTISQLKVRIKALEDTISLHSQQIWGGGGITTPQPNLAFYYAPVNFGITQSDTTRKYYIKNVGTGVLNVYAVSFATVNEGDTTTNPFLANIDSCRNIAAGDSQEVYIRFNVNSAYNQSFLYERKIVFHSNSYDVSTDSFYVSGTFIPLPAPTVDDSANIYVSSSTGNDATGTGTRANPYKTIAKGLSVLTKGQALGLKRGDTFNENVIINKDSITIKAYGTGLKPIIQTYDSIPNWWDVNSWSLAQTNVWRMPLTNIKAPNSRLNRLWLNGVEVKRADFTYSPNAVYQRISVDYPFYHDAGYLYVYSASNPATAYNSMRSYVRIGVGNTVSISSDYVTLDGIDVRGGGMGSIGFKGADKLTIINCNVGRYTNSMGINGSGYFVDGTDLRSDSVVIKKDTIDSYADNIYIYDAASGNAQGIYLGGGDGSEQYNSVNYSLIDSCYIRNWWFGVYIIQQYHSPSQYNVVRNCEISNDNEKWYGGKGIQIYSWSKTNGDTTGMSMYTRIYNNYIHDMGGSGICIASNSNYVYFNIIDSVYIGKNEHVMNYSTTYDTTDGNGGYGIEFGTERSSQAPAYESMLGNYIFNNTIYKNHQIAFGQAHRGSFIFNNLVLDTYSKPYMLAWGAPIPIIFWGLIGNSIKNNLYSRTNNSINANTYIAALYGGGELFTTSQLNNRTNCSGNAFIMKSLSETMNNDFTIPVGSEARNAGLDITNLIEPGFKDMRGNTVNRSTPNIGAIDND